ncbi:pilin [Bergeriella denitrificans]|uniref:Pilin n=1 Tax=Bergeriella denitrificans TaxID=494 RepID=Q462M2_BERDE|nr:pilin [Bergeriella denitrificans]AAY57844.1 pilin [Bergeriella denitrificans]STZ75357.1 Fimbrial protein P9-2 Pilin [Bergeriella denitrificans]
MKAIQKGFTIIELMIAIAIVGVLTVIALPAYQDYTGRAQVSEALSLLEAQKTSVVEYYSDKGEWPTNNAQAGIAANIRGQYTDKVEVGTGGVITATMRTDGINSEIRGRTIELVAQAPATQSGTTGDTANNIDGTFRWTCRPGATDGVDTKFLPASCREAANNTSATPADPNQ